MRKRIIVLCFIELLLITGVLSGGLFLFHRSQSPAKDPFAGITPRTPCATHSQREYVLQEKYGTPLPELHNPEYCNAGVAGCKGTYTGKLITRYDNTELLRTGKTTLDIATDDGSPLGYISAHVVDVTISPFNTTYTTDSTARFVLSGNKVDPNQLYNYNGAIFDQKQHQMTYPLSINIVAWCDQHSYKAVITQKLVLQDI